MAKINLENAYALEKIYEFSGIDRRAVLPTESVTSELSNFRILGDGSLEKRCGYRSVITFDEEIRGMWSGKIGGVDTLFCVVGDQFYSVDIENETYTSMGTLSTSSGDVVFFGYDGELYFFDSQGFFRYTAQSGIVSLDGYVPLYGSEWDTHIKGPVNEPINLLSRQIRVHYANKSVISTITLPMAVESLDKIYINNSDYTYKYGSALNSSKTAINIPSSYPSGEVLLYLTLPESAVDRSAICSATKSFIYTYGEESRIFLYGGNDKKRIYISRYVSDESLTLSQKANPTSCKLYFPIDSARLVGDGNHSISAICSHYDRALVFTDGNAWMMEGLADELSFIPINSVIDTMPYSAIVCENSPYTVSKNGVYVWDSRTDIQNACVVTKISSLLGDFEKTVSGGERKMFDFRKYSELWIMDPSDVENRVWIYNYETKNWYSFTNIKADLFFDYKGELAFILGNRIFIFDESRDADGEDNTPILALYKSSYFGFGKPRIKKRADGFIIFCQTYGSDISIGFETEEESWNTVLQGTDSENYECFERRIPIGRFKNMKLTISAGGNKRQKIYSLAIAAKK